MNFKEIQKLIVDNGGTLFGSRAWIDGWDKPDAINSDDHPFSIPVSSDWDYIVELPAYEKIRESLESAGVKIEFDSLYYMNSFYVKSDDGQMVNVVTIKSSERQAWVGAISMMNKCPDMVVKNKMNRQQVFEVLLAMFKRMM